MRNQKFESRNEKRILNLEFKFMKTIVSKILEILNQLIEQVPRRQLIDYDLNVPYISGKAGNCGITCVMMLFDYYGVSLSEKDKFIKKHKTKDNYGDPIGWTHQGLVNILSSEGIPAKKRNFKSLSFVIRQIIQHKNPVIVSLKVPAIDNISQKKLFAPIDKGKPLEGHICLTKGIRGKNVILHDPRNFGIYTKDLVVPFEVFEKVFSGNCIV